MSILQITLNSTEDLVFYPSANSPPATASLTITLAQGGDLPGFTWPVTVNRDTASAVVASASSQGNRVLTVDTISGFVAEEVYQLAIPDGRKFRCNLIGIDATAKQLFFDQPFAVNVPINSTITGLAYRLTLNSTATGDINRRISASWSYTVNSKTLREVQRFDIVRDPWVLSLTESDIEKYDHCFGETAGNAARWKSLIPGVGESIMLQLERRKIYADLIKDRDFIKNAAIMLLLSRFYGSRPGEDAQKLSDKWKKESETALTNITGADIWYDSDDTGTLDSSSEESTSELGFKAFYAIVG